MGAGSWRPEARTFSRTRALAPRFKLMQKGVSKAPFCPLETSLRASSVLKRDYVMDALQVNGLSDKGMIRQNNEDYFGDHTEKVPERLKDAFQNTSLHIYDLSISHHSARNMKCTLSTLLLRQNR